MKDFELLRSMFSWQKSISFDEHEMCASDTKNEIKEDLIKHNILNNIHEKES